MRSSRIDRTFAIVPQAIFLLLLLLLSLTLSGCGGGGGGASTPAPQDEMPPPQDEMPPPQDEMPPPQDETPPPQDETPPPQDETPPPQDETPPPQDETPPPVQRTPQQPVQRPTQQPVQQPPQQPVQQPPQQPVQQPPRVPVTCVQTFEGCLTTGLYRTRVEALKTPYESDDGFTNLWGLKEINAHYAWAKLELKHGKGTAPGDGITLGAVDTGIDQDHPAFVGKTVTEEFITVLLRRAKEEDGSRRSHGTAVASIMVANPSQSFITRTTGTRGVAWGADIAMFAVPTGSGAGNFVPIRLSEMKIWDHLLGWPAIIKAVTGWSNSGRSLDFVNVSLGFSSIIDMYTKAELTTNFSTTINALKQSGSSSKTVFVWSAGNGHGASCDKSDFFMGYKDLCVEQIDDQGMVTWKVNAVSASVLSGLPVRFPELKEVLIAVVAVDSNGDIASFSNRCGIAWESCIAAPGKDIRAAYFGPDQGQDIRRSMSYNGTSVASPMVTGGLAVMKHFFRSQLSNAALVKRLYATANKSGKYADQAIYGQGLMDLDKAVSPIKFTTLALGNRVGDGGISLSSTSLNLGAAFGDGLTQSFANQEIVAFDQLGAPFWYSLGSLAGTRSGPSIQSQLTKFISSTENDREFGIFRPTLGALPTEHSTLNSDRLSLGLMDTPDLVDDGGHLSLLGGAVALNRSVSDKMGFSLFSSEGNGDQARVAGMEFVSRPSKRNIAFRSGVVAERQSLLRSSAAGAFGRMSGNSVFAGLEGNSKIGSWHLSAGAEVGTVIADIDESLLSVKSPLTTSAFAFRARTQLNERDTLNFALSQPVRIESGRAEYTIPVGRTVDGDVLKSSYTADLEPSGRQIDLAMQWRRALPSGNGDFRLATGLSFHPGHSDAAEPTIGVLAGWRLGF